MKKPKCPIHNIELICYCPACRGSVKSERKTASSRLNGRKGGRPRKTKSQTREKAR